HRQTHYCGMVAYPEPESLERRLKAIMKRVSDYFSLKQSSETPFREKSETPLKLALSIERELDALRPFARDNQVCSERIIDSITFWAALPPLKNLPELFMPEERFLQLGLQAAADSIRDLRAKLRQLETEGTKVPGDK